MIRAPRDGEGDDKEGSA